MKLQIGSAPAEPHVSLPVGHPFAGLLSAAAQTTAGATVAVAAQQQRQCSVPCMNPDARGHVKLSPLGCGKLRQVAVPASTARIVRDSTQRASITPGTQSTPLWLCIMLTAFKCLLLISSGEDAGGPGLLQTVTCAPSGIVMLEGWPQVVFHLI